jgi:uncharacterized protein (DUF433 family)
MIDKFSDPLLTPRDVARHLRIPESTLYYWLREDADGMPLVHRVEPEKRGWPSVPFVAVVEAYVLRSLRTLRLSKSKIRDAAAGRLRLSQYPDVAPVVIDPRFGWGAPVIESTKVPVEAGVDLWFAGESLERVAYEYGMTAEQVEAICRAAASAA